MTTNDVINMIRANYNNLDSLAQIASAVECMQEKIMDEMTYPQSQHDAIFTHKVKVFRIGGGVEYIKCVSEEDAKVARKQRVAQGGVNCILIGTCKQIDEMDAMFV
jgi:hypothetical protein